MSGRTRIDVSVPKVTAAGLGTVLATVAGSYLGVTGTLLGAGLMSIMTATGGAVLEPYLDRGGRRVRRATAKTVSTVKTVSTPRSPGNHSPDRPEPAAPATPTTPTMPAKPVGSAGETPPSERTVEFRVPALDGGSGQAPGGDTSGAPPDGRTPAGERGGDRNGPTRWRGVALSAVLLFAAVMGGVTLFEALTGKPLANTVRGEPGNGISLGGGGAPATPTPEPTATATPGTTSGTPSPSTRPPAPTTAPTRPTARPTTSRPVPGPTTSGKPTRGPTPRPGGQPGGQPEQQP